MKELTTRDQENSNGIWWKEIVQVMKMLRIDFELYKGNTEDLPHGYQEVSFLEGYDNLWDSTDIYTLKGFFMCFKLYLLP